MIFWIGLRNLRVRALATFLTVWVVALATAIALVVPLTLRQLDRGATEAVQVFDLLVTAKGSPTQAVLSSLFYLDVPIGNLPYARYRALAEDPRTVRAVPLGFGDNVRGYPLVGTTAEFFSLRLEQGAAPYFRLRQGEAFALPFQAVLGARVAQAMGLGLGDAFGSAHGHVHIPELEGAAHAHVHPATQREIREEIRRLQAQVGEAGDEAQRLDLRRQLRSELARLHQDAGVPAGDDWTAGLQHAEEYTVVGVLEPTGGPVDQAVLVDLESLWLVHGQFDPASRGVTAILYTAERLSDYYAVAQEVNASPDAQAVFTGAVFAQLRGFVSQGQAAYAALSLLVLVLAALTIWLNLYAGALERRRSVALLRTLGASRPLIFTLVLLETALTIGLGLALGVGLSYGFAALGGSVLGAALGFVLPPPDFEPALVGRVLLLLPLGLLAALIPAYQATQESPLDYL